MRPGELGAGLLRLGRSLQAHEAGTAADIPPDRVTDELRRLVRLAEEDERRLQAFAQEVARLLLHVSDVKQTLYNELQRLRSA